MKRFLLFRGERYYPRGGWLDFVKSFDALKDAIRATVDADTWRWDPDTGWAMVVDSKSGQMVWWFEAGKTRDLPQE